MAEDTGPYNRSELEFLTSECRDNHKLNRELKIFRSAMNGNHSIESRTHGSCVGTRWLCRRHLPPVVAYCRPHTCRVLSHSQVSLHQIQITPRRRGHMAPHILGTHISCWPVLSFMRLLFYFLSIRHQFIFFSINLEKEGWGKGYKWGEGEKEVDIMKWRRGEDGWEGKRMWRRNKT
jgi:hypothetical protein